jgi:8-oxo-dGTP pyrophosphatase MutT (NUDIX family)
LKRGARGIIPEIVEEARTGSVVDLTLTHAGGVVLRTRANSTLVLLVRAKPEPHDWVLPKGHIEPGEAPDQTAQREVAEEAGVDALPTKYLGTIEFDSPRGGRVRAGYFLMQFRREVRATEEREICWCTVADALKRVRFENTRTLIRDAFNSRARRSAV